MREGRNVTGEEEGRRWSGETLGSIFQWEDGGRLGLRRKEGEEGQRNGGAKV